MKQFLESEIPDRPPEQCAFHVLCAPMEETVSYGGGTARGPDAILNASVQLEAFDGRSCPCELGIHTVPGTFQTLDAIERGVSRVWKNGKLPILLGGEHTVTLGALRALKAAGASFGVVQFDAHADLRDEYEGSALSHACVMRRALDDLDLPLAQIGVRALSLDEHHLRTEREIIHHDADELARTGIPSPLLPPGFPEAVYITFDVDALDPSVLPATGTPEPGGLSWRDAVRCLQAVVDERRVLGADFVELAPVPGLHAPDYTVARLIYALMGMLQRRTGNSSGSGLNFQSRT